MQGMPLHDIPPVWHCVPGRPTRLCLHGSRLSGIFVYRRRLQALTHEKKIPPRIWRHTKNGCVKLIPPFRKLYETASFLKEDARNSSRVHEAASTVFAMAWRMCAMRCLSLIIGEPCPFLPSVQNMGRPARTVESHRLCNRGLRRVPAATPPGRRGTHRR